MGGERVECKFKDAARKNSVPLRTLALGIYPAYRPPMPRYDAYTAQTPSVSPTKGWFISALTGSLVVHLGLFLWFYEKQIENFGPSDQPVVKHETLQRVKIYEDKNKKPDELKATLPETKKSPKKDLTLPTELPKPEEISVTPQHKSVDTDKLFANEKPAIEMAKLDTKLNPNLDEQLPKLPDDMFTDRTGPKVTARKATDYGADGDGYSKAVQVAGQDVDQILNGLSAGTGNARRLSLPGNLTFGHDSFELSADGQTEMAKIAEAFRKFLGADLNKATFIIEGHTDPTGTMEYNQKLSEQRAASVRDWFIAHLGLPPENVLTKGYGATRPAEGVPLDGTVEQLQGHRRTEIIVRRAKH